jgi:hypothetical protein
MDVAFWSATCYSLQEKSKGERVEKENSEIQKAVNFILEADKENEMQSLLPEDKKVNFRGTENKKQNNFSTASILNAYFG